MRRARTALLVAMTVGLAAPSAWACNEPTIGLTTAARASAGDVVGFSIARTDPGAQYTVSIDGRPVASGVAETRSENHTFRMPDLGSETHTVFVLATVDHDGAQWNDSKPIEFVVPAAAAVQPPPAPAPQAPAQQSQPGTTQPSAQQPLVQPQSQPRQSVAPRTTVKRSTPAKPAAPRARQVVVTQAGAAAKAHPRPATPRARTRPQAETGARSRPTFRQADPLERSAEISRTASPRRPTAPMPRRRASHHQAVVLPPTPRGTPAPTPRLEPVAAADTSQPGEGSGTPWHYLLLGLAALLTATAGGGFALARQRNRPLPDDVEAELQEMIAEQRARRSERVVT